MEIPYNMLNINEFKFLNIAVALIVELKNQDLKRVNIIN